MKNSDSEKVLGYTALSLTERLHFFPSQIRDILSNHRDEYFLLDHRSHEEFSQGHIEGSVNIVPDYTDIPAFIKKLPLDKVVLLISANGQDSYRLWLVLCQFRIRAAVLLFGMTGYNRKAAGKAVYTGDCGGAVETKEHFLPQAEPSAKYSNKGAIELIVENTSKSNYEFRIKKPEKIDDYLIISMQSREDYLNRHIPNAVNIPFHCFLDCDKVLLSLPQDRPILVTCYIGHYSSFGAMLLRQLGYTAYSLEWGLAGWNNKDCTGEKFTYLTKGLDLPVVR